MLEKIDLSRKLGKEEYKRMTPVLGERLGSFQRKARDRNIPVVILFEGWEASGKGTLMNELILPLDPRGFRVHYVHSSADDNQNAYWPPMRRFWALTPPRGRIGIFSRSWYRLILDKPRSIVTYEDISSFERQLSQDGCLIVKFFLHISKKEQKKRLKRMDEDAASTWRVSEREWEDHKNYDATVKLIEEMIQKTDKAYAPWTIVESNDKRYATVKILTTVADCIERRLEQEEKARNLASEQPFPSVASAKEEEAIDESENPILSSLALSVLKNLDLDKQLEKGEYKKKLPVLQNRLRELQYELYKVRRPMVVVFEGPDAAGKGGCIKRLTQRLDPRGYQVSPTASPNDWEKAHHYLWRFWDAFPKAGHICIYDRSWYGRVLVERVEGFAAEWEWRRAYEEINEMEAQWFDYGCIILKFWLQIDSDEQLARFTERQRNPDRNWKITPEDWRNREKWSAYEEAAEEMILRTSTTFAPWTIVQANDKEFARIKVLRKTVGVAEKALGFKGQ